MEKIGILVTDQSLCSKYGHVNISNLKPVQYGGIILSEDEEQAMMLHPKMLLFSDVREEDVELELEKSLTLLRYDLMSDQTAGRRARTEEV